MAYKPFQAPNVQRSNTTSLMAKKGENLRDLPQLLSTENANIVENYIIVSEARLKMRKGLKQVVSIAGFDGLKSLNKDGWTSNLIVVGWANSVGVIDIAAETLTTVKTDFVNSDQFDGERYGDYFFVASGSGDKVGIMRFTLAFDAQTTNFTVGAKLTGVTSGATAIILEQVDNGVDGTLTLGSIQGAFQDDEVITDDVTGSADADGIITYTYTPIANAPEAVKIVAVGPRLVVSLAKDQTTLQSSEVDDTSNPPFDAWTISAAAATGSFISFRNGGKVNDMVAMSKILAVFAEKGVWAFHYEVIDVGGIQNKIEVNDMHRVEPGGAQKALMTDKGIYYVKRGRGLYRLVSLGQEDIDFTKQEGFESVLLGSKYFDDIEFDDCDIAENKQENTLLITCKQDSTQNNYVITLNTELGAFARLTGWNIKNFVNIDGKLYGGSSIDNTFFSLFDGYLDDGNKIWTTIEQEVPIGQLQTLKDLENQYIWGQLSESTVLDWYFTRVDRTGKFNVDALHLRWCADIVESGAEGYGSAKYGSSGYGGTGSKIDAPDNFAGLGGKLRNCMRLITRISGVHDAPHELHAFSIATREKLPIKRRNLKQIS